MTRRSLACAAGAVAVLAGASSTASAKTFGGVIRDLSSSTASHARVLAHIANLPYGGGPVLHANRTHLIFWQPSGSGLSFDPSYMALAERFLQDVAADSRRPTNVYGLSGQYADATGPAAYNSTYGGAVVDTDHLSSNGCTEPLGPPLGSGPGWFRCVNDSQIEAEIRKVVHADALPTTSSDIYFLLTPSGLGSCEYGGPDYCALGGSSTGYCGYHTTTIDNLPYAVIPYNAVSGHCQSGNPRPNANAVDPTLSSLSHEHNEIVTDPFSNAWIDSQGGEDGDLCISEFGPPLGGAGQAAWNEVIHGDHYFLQEEWSNEDGGCQAQDEPDRISFTLSSRLQARSPIVFAARAFDPDGTTFDFNWFFGDGTTSRARRPSHVFKRPGTYRVVLRTTDRSGNWAFYAKTVRVGKAPAKPVKRRNAATGR